MPLVPAGDHENNQCWHLLTCVQGPEVQRTQQGELEVCSPLLGWCGHYLTLTFVSSLFNNHPPSHINADYIFPVSFRTRTDLIAITFRINCGVSSLTFSPSSLTTLVIKSKSP